jgi:hypothetical protein
MIRMMQISWFLVISYFDQIIGPSIFHCNENLHDFHPIEFDKLLDFKTREQCVILANEKYQTINYSFLIDSNFSRGGYEQMLISYIIKEEDINNEYLDIFKFLKSKQSILSDFANDLKKLDWLPQFLNIKDKNFRKTALSLLLPKYKTEFLKIYNNYFKLLYPKIIRFESEKWKTIVVECPDCMKKDKIRIPSSKINENERYTSVFIPKFKICEHSFICQIDENFNPQKYHKIDLIVSDIETENLDFQEIDLILAQRIYEYLKNIGITKPVNARRLIKFLYINLNLKVNRDYLYYLSEVIKEYFSTEIIWAKDQALDDLEELWIH